MAIVVYSALVNQVVGKHGGSVFQKLGKTLGVRQHIHYSGARTIPASKSKQQWSVICSAWNNMTSVQRQAWSTAAPTYPATNRLGNSIIWSGFQLFTHIARLFLLAGFAIPITAYNYSLPVYVTFDGPQLFLGSTTWNLSLDSGPQSGYYALVYISPLYHMNVLIKQAKCVFMYAVSCGALNVWNLYSMAIAYWKRVPTTSEWFAVTIKTINTNNNNIRDFNSFFYVTINP